MSVPMKNHASPPAKGVGLLIHDVARLLRHRIDQRAHAIGLTSAQWRVLSVIVRAELRNEPPPNQAALAEQMDLEPITLSRLVDRMEAAKLIERRPDPGDRRSHHLYLQDSARPLVAEFREVASGCMADALAGVSDAEMDQVLDVLMRIRNNLTGKGETAASAAKAKPPPARAERPPADAGPSLDKPSLDQGVSS
jgi:DNA-binding MarR family transcriptional regulator